MKALALVSKTMAPSPGRVSVDKSSDMFTVHMTQLLLSKYLLVLLCGAKWWWIWVPFENDKVLVKYKTMHDEGKSREEHLEGFMAIIVRWVKSNSSHRLLWTSWVSALMKRGPFTSWQELWCIMGTWNSSKSKGKSKLSQMALKVPHPVDIFQLTELTSSVPQRHGPWFYFLWLIEWQETVSRERNDTHTHCLVFFMTEQICGDMISVHAILHWLIAS